MSINYVLLENNLTSDPDDYMAMVKATGTAELDDVIDRMIEQGSTVVKADILSVMEDYHSAIENTHLSLIFSLHGYFLQAIIYEKALFPLFLR